MSKYKIFGIGNAMVDMEFEITDQKLNDLGVSKSLMTLIDLKHQENLLNQLGSNAKKRESGGSAANTIFVAQTLGSSTFYNCKVANDEAGSFYAKALNNAGIANNLNEYTKQDGVTGKCLVLITPDAERSMNTYLGVSETLEEKDLDEKAILDSDLIYLEGYLVTSPTGKNAAIKAREIARKNNKKISLTLSDPFIVKNFKSGLQDMIGDEKIDLLFANEDEALAYTETSTLEDAINLMKNVAKTFAITLGPKGSIYFDGIEVHKVNAPTVDAIDTNGAGDIFAGALMYGISEGFSSKKSLELATLLASTLVTVYGARLSKDTINKIKKEKLL